MGEQENSQTNSTANTEPSGSEESNGLPNLSGIWKYGKWLQARTYGVQLKQAEQNVRNWMPLRPNDKGKKSGGADDEMVNIDSPTTVHHHHPPPSTPLWAKLLLAGAAAMGIGVPVGGAMALPHLIELIRQPEVVDTDTDSTGVFEFRGDSKKTGAGR